MIKQQQKKYRKLAESQIISKYKYIISDYPIIKVSKPKILYRYQKVLVSKESIDTVLISIVSQHPHLRPTGSRFSVSVGLWWYTATTMVGKGGMR